jgi:hypothetical protein
MAHAAILNGGFPVFLIKVATAFFCHLPRGWDHRLASN